MFRDATIRLKVISGFALSTLVILLVGLIGFNGISKLSDNLSFIVGPAWDSADGAMEAEIGLEAQMLAVEKIFQGYHYDKGLESIKEAQQSTDEAIDQLRDAGLMDATQIENFSLNKSQYKKLLEEVLKEYKDFAFLKYQYDENAEKFVKLSSEIEAIGDSTVEQLEKSPSQLVTWDTGLDNMWLAADGAMESSIGLLSGLYHMARFIAKSEEHSAAQYNLNEALAFQKEAAKEMFSTGAFKLNAGSKWQNLSYEEAYTKHLDKHEELTKKLFAATHAYQTTHIKYITIADQLLVQLGKFEESGDRVVENEVDVINQIQQATLSVMTMTAIGGVVVVIIFSLLLLRSILSPLNEISTRIEDIAQGEGDLTLRLNMESKDELGTLGNHFDSFLDNIHNIISQVSSRSVTMSAEITEMDNVAQRTNESVDEQRRQTDLIATAINQMSSSGREIAQNTENAARSATEAKIVSEEAEQIVTEAISTIGSLSAEIEDATGVISTLEDEVNQIVNVLNVIVGIAEQTNLLALNAAIEAARAGEHGRGFAVVADEVRGLAGRTQQSTEEIQEMIDRLKSGSQRAVEVMTRSNEQSQSTVRQSEQVQRSLNQIASSISVINEINQLVASASEEQSCVCEEMEKNVQTVVEVATTTSEGMEQTSASCQQANQLNQDLSDLVNRFKV
ncbi:MULTISPECIES: methyl-accepting chemotaxis protein [unclassified Oleiphilus]|nr:MULTISPECIES: methyl-accepting chemotaxis protein [unclassified Oleiphilus]KZY33198.1 hypothetical protein A3729_06990 [Oleiphilus sp. HI0043]KZY60466.1 hypothetical protein A3735_12360 [Oleiphilus sp. HI0061]KZY84187.1 hypothetical protein A3741_03300 [Oleiphilus sp. HI0069]KZZ67840.1 hypothetical protein A3763_01940 [Oleiphilus sp. HI0128]